jgi:hypothetical protein
MLDERPIGATLNHELYVRGEQVDGELDRLISQRHDKRVREEGERPEEEAWVESTRRWNNAQGDALRAQRFEFHTCQAQRLQNTMNALVDHHLSEAEKWKPSR